MAANREQLAILVVRENGRPLAEARGELSQAPEFLGWFSEETVRVEGTLGLAPGGDKQVLVGHKPIAIALCITPL